MQDWTCCECGLPVAAADLMPRRPCPQCGSLARTAHVSIAETVTVNAYLKMRAKHRDGGSKVVRDITEGDDYHRKTGKWNLMRRVIDRATTGMKKCFVIAIRVRSFTIPPSR